jgi:hypothetical protein
VELYLHSPTTSSWRDAHLCTGYVFMTWYLIKHKDNSIPFSSLPIFMAYEIIILRNLPIPNYDCPKGGKEP